MFGLLADGVLIIHLAFIIFVIFGAAFVLRFRWIPFFHIPSLIWALIIEFFPQCPCPLTPLELFLREQAAEKAYTSGFVNHYIGSVIYPGITVEMHFWAGVFLFLFNGVFYAWLFSRLRKHQNIK